MPFAKVVQLILLSALSATVVLGQDVASQYPVVRTPTISTSASAEAKFTPDRATVSIAVQSKASTAAAAAADNSAKQNAVMTSLRSLGLTNKQLSTTGYSVNPEYRYPPNSPPTLTGYTVTNTVLVDIDVKQVGKVLDAAIAHGSNVISSLDFYSSDTRAAEDQALGDAVRKARASAETAAKAAGGRLGALIQLSVGGMGSIQPPRPMFMAKSVAAASETQINPGQQSLTMSASASWSFVPNP